MKANIVVSSPAAGYRIVEQWIDRPANEGIFPSTRVHGVRYMYATKLTRRPYSVHLTPCLSFIISIIDRCVTTGCCAMWYLEIPSFAQTL